MATVPFAGNIATITTYGVAVETRNETEEPVIAFRASHHRFRQRLQNLGRETNPHGDLPTIISRLRYSEWLILGASIAPAATSATLIPRSHPYTGTNSLPERSFRQSRHRGIELPTECNRLRVYEYRQNPVLHQLWRTASLKSKEMLLS